MKPTVSKSRIRRIRITLLTGLVGFVSMSSAQSQVIIESKPYRDTRQPAAAQIRSQSSAAFDLPIDALETPVTKAKSAQAPTQPVAPVVVAPAAPVVVTQAPVTIPVWEIRLSDNNLSRALTRWAATAPEKLPILWEAAQDLPIVAANYSGDFLSAIEQVMRDTGNSQYPLHACAYDNIVRVLHVSQPCVRGAIAPATVPAVYGAEK